MVKCSATAKSFPWGGASRSESQIAIIAGGNDTYDNQLACEARLKRAAVGSYFTHILRQIRTMYHFARGFKVYRCVPPPSSAPASRGTFPQGKVLAVAWG